MPRRKHKKGKGLVENVKNTFNGILEGAKKANTMLRDTKAISKGTRILSQLPTPVSSVFSNISAASDALGYGKRGRHSRKMHGRGDDPNPFTKQLAVLLL